MIKKYRYEFEYNDDNDEWKYCPLTTAEYEALCGCDEVLFCKGVMSDRPDNCPLVEVKDENKD